MRYNSSEGQFYDRKDERKSITKQIRDNGTRGQIIVLAGTSGVGKSSLAQKLLQDELKDYKSVILRIGKSSIGTIENLSYFNTLYQSIINLAMERKDYKLKTASQYGWRNIFNWLRIIWGIAKNYLNFDPERRISEPVEEYSVSRKKEYILSVLKKGPFIVNIQNIQNIDIQSAELFQNIFKDIPTLIWIMEYTLPDEGMNQQFYSFANEWKTLGTPYYVYEIQKLDFELAFNLAPPEVHNSRYKRRLEAQYEKAHGNLLTLMVIPKNLDEDEDYIRSKLESLDQDQKYIVYILYLNETPMPESILFSILTQVNEPMKQHFFSHNKSMSLLQSLKADKIILQQDGTYSIKHDSLSNILSQLSVNSAMFLAFRALENHYRQQMELGSPNEEEYICHLFSLYVRFHDENFTSLLPKLWKLILAAKYPKEIIQKIEQYKQHILLNSGTNFNIIYLVTRFLTELCIRLQYPEKAQENLDIIYSIRPSQYLIGLQGAIYAIRSSSENWNNINALIASTKNESRLRLSLCLCRLRMMMRYYDSNTSKAYAEKLLDCPAYENMPEYGFLIYNYAEFSKDPVAALKLYWKALNIFKKYGLANMQAEVNISMSMSFSYAGQLKNARKAIQRAKNLAPGYIPEAVILNNSAVIDILDGKVTPSVLNKLADAALMDTNPYELLIIKSNWLTGLTLCNCIEQAADLALEIEQSDYEIYQYEDFLHIVCQDLLFYYTKIEDEDKIAFYRRKLINLAEREGMDSGTRELILSMLQKDQLSNHFYAQFPFRVDFLGFWGLVISRDLENYQ